MGVPKFFRYISERYPCLSELVRENQIPEFDNLYLDMNGIIHVCSHPNDNDPHFRISEEDIFKNIAHYIEILFRMIQPQKLFFMAVDGVAPRAKMNQQRGRRFRSAKEAQDLEDAAKAKGEELPKEARFDSNCITPGTAFMTRLQEFLKSFVQRKMNYDTNWQKCRVILSGHETPGEGEHKIMEYIRYLKASPGYDPNTRHCLYGLDADLIMLGLCSHEPHFSLLREEVKFGKQANSRNPTAEETRFYLLHLSLLRDYLEQEFISLKDLLPFKYDMESIIDDWIFMGFLVGNDFIPHLPNLHINSNALPLLYNVYKETLPELDGYINECGILNLNRLEIFMERLSVLDKMHFSDANADLKYFTSKLTDDAWVPEHKKNESDNRKSKDLQDLISAVDDMFLDDDSPDNDFDESLSFDIRDKNLTNMTDEEILEEEFNLYKRDYYINKLGYKEVTPDVLSEQAECYIRALQWTLAYYYRGVCSWGWYYPHHYAPFMSDVKNFAGLDYSFNLGKPFLPFEQLLAVLPAASGKLLPEAYRKLMVSADSPILHYYPSTFETDLNGKKQEWEAVVLIPFIEEDLLLKSMEQQRHLLLPEEASRNIHGPMLQYDFVPGSDTTFASEESMPDLTANIPRRAHTVTMTEIQRSDVYVPPEKLVLGPVEGAEFDVYYPGFPTMKHLKYTSRLEKGQVRVFEQATRNDSMIMELENTSDIDVQNIAKDILGKSVYVQWPHLVEALVKCVIDDKFQYKLDNNSQVIKEPHTELSRNEYHSFKKSSKKHYFERMGIDIKNTQVLLQVHQLKNRVYVFGKQGGITLEKEWCNIVSHHPLQTCVLDLKVHDTKYKHYESMHEVFSKDQRIYLLSKPYYGSMAVVYNPEQQGRLKIGVMITEEPDFTDVKKNHYANINSYLNAYDAASRVGISTYLLGRITGTVFIMSGSKDKFDQQDTTCRKHNIGLNLKFTKKNEEVTGYSRRVGNTWYYSQQAINLMMDYMEKFPQVFRLLNQGSYSEMVYESDLFPNEVGTGKLENLLDWLKAQPHNDALRKSSDSQALTVDIVREVQNILKKPRRVSRVTIVIKPIHVFVPGLQPGARAPDPKAVFKLFDRVVNVRPNHTVPLGNKGTVIGVHICRDPNPIHQPVNDGTQDIFLDVLFDESFPGASGYCGMEEKNEEKRCYRMSPQSLINLTFGNESDSCKKYLTPKGGSINANQMNQIDKLMNYKKAVETNQSALNRSIEKACIPKADRKSAPALPPANVRPTVSQILPKPNIVDNENGKEKGKLGEDVKEYQNKMNSCPEQRKMFWDDLLKQKSNPVTALPSADTETETLKQLLGVNKQKQQEQPTVSQSSPKPMPVSNAPTSNWRENANPISVEDMFKHAAKKASSTIAPNLPQPPKQWYGPKNQNDHRQVHKSPNKNQQQVANMNHSPKNAQKLYPNFQMKNNMVLPHGQYSNTVMPPNNHFPNNQLPIQPMHFTNKQQLMLYTPLLKQQSMPPNHVHNLSANTMNVVKCDNQELSKNKNPKSALQTKVDSSPSAFIPLQAIKKDRLARTSTGSVPKDQPTSPCSKEVLDELKKLENKQKRKEVERKQSENQMQFQKFLMNSNSQQNSGFQQQQYQESNTDRVKSATKFESGSNKKKPRPPKKSRVAANFGQPI